MKKLLLYGDIPVNCYILTEDKHCLIIDPGSDEEKLKSYIESEELEVDAILLTHGHHDHIGAIHSFQVPIYASMAEKPLIESHYHKHVTLKIGLTLDTLDIRWFEAMDSIPFRDKSIKIINTPGHTVGSVSYLYDNELICGDTLFQGAVGRWDFETGDQEVLRSSVIKLIESLPESINIHPGHGPSSTIAYEKANNQYYHVWKEGYLFQEYTAVDNH